MLLIPHFLNCRTFEWLDDKKGSSKKLSKTPAKQFIDTSLTQIQKQLEDETIFPTKFGMFLLLAHTCTHAHTHAHTIVGFEFPPEFVTVVKKIFRTYFAILAHIYYHHFKSMLRLSLHEGLNTLLLHLVYFVQEFSLMEPRELQCMDELITKLLEIDREYARNPPKLENDGLASATQLKSESKPKSNSLANFKT